MTTEELAAEHDLMGFHGTADRLREMEAEIRRLRVALVEARHEAHSLAHSEFDGVWDEGDFAALTPLADAILFAALNPAAQHDTAPQPDQPAAPKPGPGSA